MQVEHALLDMRTFTSAEISSYNNQNEEFLGRLDPPVVIDTQGWLTKDTSKCRA